VTTAYFSDKTKRRGVFLMFWSIIGAIGYSMLLGIPIKNAVSSHR
jgi:hypothetical protein